MIYLEWRSKVKDRRDRQNKKVRRGTEEDDKERLTDRQTDER